MKRFPPAEHALDLDHAVVYRSEQEFAAWPFNNGLWRTQNADLVVAFMRNACAYSTPTDCSHRRSIDAPGARISTLRSADGGATWDPDRRQDIATFPEISDRLTQAGVEHAADQPAVDFTDADVLVVCGSAPDFWSDDSRAWTRISTDGGRRWREPTLVPLEGSRWLHGRSSTLVRSDGACLLFLTTHRRDGSNGRPVTYATLDGGQHWISLGFLAPDRPDHITSCPRAVSLPGGGIIAALRCQVTRRSAWTEIWISEDGARSWRFLSRLNDVGAPTDLVVMHDGRLLAVYGYRTPPYGVRARLSEDEGKTWGGELIVRDDGGSWDLGYPRAVETEPGRILTVYYMNLAEERVRIDGGVRHIARSSFMIA